MIVSWMLYAALIAALVTVAAMVAERALRVWRAPVRWVWPIAMLLSVVLPVAGVLAGAGLARVVTLPPIIIGAAASPVAAGLARAITVGSSPVVDIAVLVLWALASAVLLLALVRARQRLQSGRVRWSARELGGTSVFVAPDTGPAVVGFRRPTVVIPEWMLDMEAPLRDLVLLHEREHVERGDARLLHLGVLAVSLLPWNPAFWFMAHRLRGAIEIDCDARVLRARPDARRYGALLLLVGQRSAGRTPIAPSLTEPASLLARRIVAMRAPRSRHPVAASLSLGAVAALFLLVACEASPPSEPAEARIPVPDAAPIRFDTTGLKGAYFEFQVEQPVTQLPGSASPRYPDILRQAEIEGDVMAQFVVDEQGVADVSTFKVLKSSHDLFTESVRLALPNMRFTPARVGGKAVKQLVQQPFGFRVAR